MTFGGQLAPATAQRLGVRSQAVYPLVPCGTPWRPQYLVGFHDDEDAFEAASGEGLHGRVLELAELQPDFRIVEPRRTP